MNSRNLLIGIIVACGLLSLVVALWPAAGAGRPAADEDSARRDGAALLADGKAASSPMEFVLPAEPPTLSAQAESTNPVLELHRHAFAIAQAVARKLPTHPAALSLLGRLHLRHGQIESARHLWNRALELEPGYVDAYLDLGLLERNCDHLAEAEGYFRQALIHDPRHAGAIEQLGSVLVARGDFAAAVEILAEYTNENHANLPALNTLGSAYQQLGQFANASSTFAQALAVNPQSREACLGLMTAQRCLGEHEQASQTATQLVQLDSAEPRVAADRDLVSHDLLKARELVTYTVLETARLLGEVGDQPSAVQVLQRGRGLVSSQSEILEALVAKLLTLGDVKTAVEEMHRACLARPAFADNWLALGKLCMQSRNLALAETALNRYVALQPTDAMGFSLLAQTQMVTQQDTSLAVANARRALALDGTARSHYVLATTLYHHQATKDAEAELKAAIELEPTNQEFRDALLRLRQAN